MLCTIMARNKKTQGSGTETVRKLTKTGQYTYYVTIPKADIEALGWRERQRLVVRRVGDKIVVEDWKR
jgi:bifunctional DNA-binding transcriptional regulator/antitoxin component of YhaV-PrlF toxin-antitoxin module